MAICHQAHTADNASSFCTEQAHLLAAWLQGLSFNEAQQPLVADDHLILVLWLRLPMTVWQLMQLEPGVACQIKG